MTLASLSSTLSGWRALLGADALGAGALGFVLGWRGRGWRDRRRAE